MTQTHPLRQYLKHRTLELHDRLDRRWSLTGPDGAGRYPHFLLAVGSVAPGIYERLRASPELAAVVPDIAERDRTAALLHDLDRLGLALPSSRAPDLPGLPEQLGAAYVMEGSTLGGQVLVRALEPTIPGTLGALRYVAGHGAQTGARWGRFLAALEAAPLDESGIERCVAGARATFQALLDAADATEDPSVRRARP